MKYLIVALFVGLANRYGAYLDTFSSRGGFFDTVFGEWGFTLIAVSMSLPYIWLH
jgi:hypothetical protein